MSGNNSDLIRFGRQDSLIKEQIHDPYKVCPKPAGMTECSSCGAIFSSGRWHWPVGDIEASKQMTCPACRCIQDKVPAGFLTLKGVFFNEHRDEIMRLVHNNVEEQKAQYPLKRIMDITDGESSVVISFTDVHLIRGVGGAIKHAFGGDLQIQYSKEAGLVRVYWER